MPSGRLLSDLRRPGGSRIAGMWTEPRAHLTISLSAVCRTVLIDIFFSLIILFLLVNIDKFFDSGMQPQPRYQFATKIFIPWQVN